MTKSPNPSIAQNLHPNGAKHTNTKPHAVGGWVILKEIKQ